MEPMLKDDVDVDTGGDMDSQFEVIVESLRSRYNKSEAPHKRILLRSAVELANLVTTSMTEPPPKINTRGRPKAGKKNKQSKKEASTKREPSLFEYKESVVASCSIKVIRKNTRSASANFVTQMPVEYQPYVLDTKNVMADGHYGFRTVASLMGFGEDNWVRVRQDLMNELSRNLSLYAGVFLQEEKVGEVLESLNCFTESARYKHWFTLPYMGYLVSSAYNVAFITFSNEISLTFLPLHSAPPERPRSICMGMVNNNHFIHVFLSDERHMPPITLSWRTHHKRVADDWGLAYDNRRIN
ncbi:hypothetical protein ACS0TY_004878 [Phlomoides rotata]